MTQQRSITFFIDRCLECNSVIEAFRNAGITIEVHRDHFLDNAQDVDWLPEVGKREWVILTKDSKISKNPLERNAVARAGIKMFTLNSANLSGEKMIKIFLTAIVKIQHFAYSHPAPFIAKVSSQGKIEMLYSSQKLQKELK